MTRYDAVVIGSGVSGLAAGCLLAETGRRVAVLEQHTVPGGLMQRFRRRGIPFDTGLHYIGGTGPGGPLRRYLSRLGVLDRIRLAAFDPDGFDEVVLPGRRFRFPVGCERVRDALSSAFPADREAIGHYFERLEDATRRHPFFSFESNELGMPDAYTEPPTTVSEALRGIQSDEARAILSAHTLLYGVAADRAALPAHALVCGSFYHSTHAVVGGGDALAGALVQRLAELGGELLLRTDVLRIRTENRQVTGVDTDGAGGIETDCVIATVHPSVVVGLVGEAALAPRTVRRVQSLRNTPSALLVHGVVRGVSPESRPRNWLWFPAPEDAWRERRPWFGLAEAPPGLGLLVGPPREGAPDSAVFQVFCPMRAAEMGERDSSLEWKTHKMAEAIRLSGAIEDCAPEWRGRYEIVDVSTPRAMQRFVRSPEGSCYGVECSAEQWGLRWRLQSLGIQGLRLAGQSVGLPGVLGSIVTSFVAVGAIDQSTARLYAELRRIDAHC